MNEYLKIQSIFKRDPETHKFIIGEWSLPEFEYLQNNIWECTEKIDGMNIRIIRKGASTKFAGKTDRATLPKPLTQHLGEVFSAEACQEIWDDIISDSGTEDICLYGEGYGGNIQSGGKYRPDQAFILFDVKIGHWWLKREDVEDIASGFAIPVVPVVRWGTIHEAISLVASRLKSEFGDFLAEGLVLKTFPGLRNRAGNRIITKIKHVDFL